MGLIETDETNQFTFEAFASHAFYTEINRSLVQHALTSILINSLPSDSSPAFLLLTAYLRVTAPFTMELMLREPNDFIACGPGEQLAGCEKSIRKCTYHARQKLRPCSSLTGKDTFACS